MESKFRHGHAKEREFEYTWEDFDYLRALSSQFSGIVASDEKFDMFYSRLTRRLRALNLGSFREYCHFLEQHHSQEFSEFINAITTNLTAFYREQHHFEYLQTTLIPELLRSKQHERQITVWSAGCSTGEEAYSIAITLLDNVPADWKIKILATDIDTRVLELASKGEYFRDRSGLSDEILQRWFKKGVGKNQGKIKVKPALRQAVDFTSLNLVADWPGLKSFDFIFCRNVLIYFDRPTKERLVQRFSTLLPVGARLFIGHSESIHQLDVCFRAVGNTIYQRITSDSRYGE
jgi:chemotaxis protein methyltransferase CheR